MTERFKADVCIPKGFYKLKPGYLMQRGDYCLVAENPKGTQIRLYWEFLGLREDEYYQVCKYHIIIRKKVQD